MNITVQCKGSLYQIDENILESFLRQNGKQFTESRVSENRKILYEPYSYDASLKIIKE